MTELVAHCRFAGKALDALAGQDDCILRLNDGDVFRLSLSRSRREWRLSLAAGDWRRLALAKARVAGELRRLSGCANLPVSWEGDGSMERLGHVQHWRVTHAERVTPRMRRVTFLVEDASFYVGDFHHVRLLLPARTGKPFDFPRSCPAGLPIWPEAERMPALRNYTIRAVRPALQQVDVDFLLHEPAGPAAAWARLCRPGALIGALGPIGRPVNRGAMRILLGDQTAMPTILRQIEERRTGECIDAYIELDEASERQDVPIPYGCSLHWLRRGELIEALLALGRQDRSDVFGYAGSEFVTARNIGAAFAAQLGLPNSRFRSVAYWRMQAAGAA